VRREDGGGADVLGLTRQGRERADTVSPKSPAHNPGRAGASGCRALPAAQGQSSLQQCPILRQQRQRCLACVCCSPALGSRACRAVPASTPAPQPPALSPQPQSHRPPASSLAPATAPPSPSRTPTPDSSRESIPTEEESSCFL